MASPRFPVPFAFAVAMTALLCATAQGAEPLVRVPETPHRAGYGDRQVPDLGCTAGLGVFTGEHVRGGRRRRPSAEVQCARPLAGYVSQQESTPADVTRFGVHDREREGDGHGCIDRVAALFEHRQRFARLGREAFHRVAIKCDDSRHADRSPDGWRTSRSVARAAAMPRWWGIIPPP